MRVAHWWTVAPVALVAVLIAGSGAAAKTPDPDLDLAQDVVSVEGVEVPLRGSFTYPNYGRGDDPLVRGVVHGAYRVDGATALYYSLTEETKGIGNGGTQPFLTDIQQPWNYGYNMATPVELLDVVGLQGYRPLVVDGEALTSATKNLQAEPGELVVVFALFPELPEGVASVDVRIGRDIVAGVPVGDGGLTPIAEESAVLLGRGWPELPSSDRIAAAAPEGTVFSLSQRTADLEQVAQTEETVEQVAVTLDANVVFDKASAGLSAGAQSTLADVAAEIVARGTGTVVVTGHTDSDGGDADNQVLSEERAASVVAALAPVVGDKVALEAVGKGESEPVASNSSPEGQQANRRVTIVFSVQEGER